MLYLLWMILNTFLFLYFIYLCFKGVKVVRERYGLGIAIFFGLALMSFISASGDANDKKDIARWESLLKDDSLAYRNKGFKEITVTKNLMFSIKLHVAFSDKNGSCQPYSANCIFNGLKGGYDWQPRQVSIEKVYVEEGLYEYHVQYKRTLKILALDLFNYYNECSGRFRIE